MVEIRYKHARTNASRRRHLSNNGEQFTNAKKNASFQGLPFGKSSVIVQALNRMQSDMQVIGFSKKTS